MLIFIVVLLVFISSSYFTMEYMIKAYTEVNDTCKDFILIHRDIWELG